MKSTYGQYCPLALASEVLGERWTILIIFALCNSSSRFNSLQRALPRISASTLSQRLRSLEDSGVIRKQESADGSSIEYQLTDAGEDLVPIVKEMGKWGQRWARDLEVEDLDPRHLIWSVHLRLNLDAMPPGRTTIQFEFTDVRQIDRYYWIVVNERKVDVCLKHPGHDPDVFVASEILRFIDAWRGIRSLEKEVMSGRIKVTAPPQVRNAFTSWLLLSAVAHVDRQRPGRERALQRRLSDKRDTANHKQGEKNGLKQHYANRRRSNIGQRLE
jgi:DNA-binding HxlR family transcriptional regulator